MHLTDDERRYLDRCHAVGEELLGALDAVCAELGIGYGIIAGTLIGAVRHRGWIPWDDDVDVAMTRADFERFRAEAPALLPSNIKFSDVRSSPDHITVIPRLLHMDAPRKVFARERSNRPPETAHVPLDIFILDNPPRQGIPTRAWLATLRLLEKMIVARNTTARMALTDPTSSAKKKLVETFGVLTSRLRSAAFWRQAHTDLCARFNRPDADVVSIPNDFSARYRSIRFPVESFMLDNKLHFEGKPYRAPRDPHTILSRVYGEGYMQPPPQDQQRPIHMNNGLL